MSDIETDPLIPLSEAARRLGLTPSAAHKRVLRTGELHPRVTRVHRIGTRLYVSEFEIEDIVNRP